MNDTISLLRKTKFNYTVVLNYLIIIYAFCIPITDAGTNVISLLLLIVWLLEGKFSYKFEIMRSNNFLVILGLFIAYSMLAVIWSSDKLFALDYVRKYHHLLVIPLIYTSLDVKYIDNIFKSFLAAMTLSVIVSYGIFFELFSYDNVASFDPSPFMDHTNYSIYLVISVLILLYKMIYAEKFKLKLLFLIYMLLILSNLFIIEGRTGQVAFFVCLVVIGILNFKSKIRASLLMILGGIIIFTSAYYISPVFENRVKHTKRDITMMITEKDYSGSMAKRISLWIIGTHVFLDNIIIGTGIGDDSIGINEYAQKYNFVDYLYVDEKEYVDYHNAFVQYAAQLGIIGLVLFVLLFYNLFILKFENHMYRNLNVLFTLLMVLLSTVGLTLHLMNSMILFSLFTGLFTGISFIERKKTCNKYGIINH